MEETKLKMVIEGENRANETIKQAKTQVEALQKQVKSMAPTFKTMATAGTVAFGAIIGEVALSVKAFAESEAQLARTDQALRNIDLAKIGSSFDEASKKAREFGSQLQKTAGIGDEAGAESFAKLLAITNDYAEAQKYANLAADLSVAKQMDMSSATKVVAMALAGNVKILKEYGIEVEEGASKQVIMAEIMKRVGGQAEAYGKTFEGQTAIMKESIGDLQETIGATFAPILTDLIKQLTPLLQSFQKWAQDNPELLKTIVLVAGALAGLVAVVGALGLALPAIIAGFAFLTGPIGAVIIALGALTMAVILIKDNWNGALETMKIATETIFIKIQTFFLNLKVKIIEVIDSIKAKIQPMVDMVSGITKTASNIGGSISNAFGQASNFLLGSRENGGYIPQTGPYLLHQGEYVVPKNNSSGTNITFNFNGDVSDIDTLQRKIIETLNRSSTLKSFAGQ